MGALAASLILVAAGLGTALQGSRQGEQEPPPWYPHDLIAVGDVRGHLMEGRFREPGGVFFEPVSGELFVADMKNAMVGIFDAEGIPLFSFGGRAQLLDPAGLYVDTTGTIHVLDNERSSIKVFNYRGEPQEPIWFTRPGTQDESLRMADFAVGPQGRWHVADAERPRVLVYAPDGTLEVTIPRADGVGKFELVSGVAVSSEGLIAVIDNKGIPVQIFDSRGNFVSGFGNRDIGGQGFSAPIDVTFDEDGYLYVVDLLRHDVKVFDVEGNFLRVFGGWFSPATRGTGPGEMLYPSGISIAPDGGLVYVSERYGQRVQIFRRQPRKDSPPIPRATRRGVRRSR